MSKTVFSYIKIEVTVYIFMVCAVIRFGSIVVGAIRSIKREKNGKKRTSSEKWNRRGSFSFQGGMQVNIFIDLKSFFCYHSMGVVL